MGLAVKFIIACSLFMHAAGDYDGRWPTQVASSTGLCRYGNRIDCCWGWARQSWGQCQPFYYVLRQRIASVRCRTQAVCQPACKHGECIGPNKCKCHPGYTGKTCNQDLNECGLKPRPCKYRCMNTYGSYKCYCLNGYMMMPDGTCSNALTCSMANCQYGCDIVKGEVRCRCPSPGLQLGPDGRTCVDVDECATGKAVCPRFRKCVNTFGSYICKCYPGYDLIHAHGKYQCFDIDECYTGDYQCSNYARCYNTPGSYKCKCSEGYRGNGADCTQKPHPKTPKTTSRPAPPVTRPAPKPATRPPPPATRPPPPATRPPPPATRPPPPATRPPQPATRPPQPATRPPPPATRPPPPATRPPQPVTKRPQPVTRPPQPPTKPSTSKPPIVVTTALPQSPTRIPENNKIEDQGKQRGDVFIPRHENNIFFHFDVERGLSADEYEENDDPGVLVHSCNFDNGLCGWIRDRENDLHWELVKDDSGGKYLTVMESKTTSGKVARLVLPLGQLSYSGDLCLSFRHLVSGENSGKLQVFVRRSGFHGPAVWGRNGSSQGWGETRITLPGTGVRSIVFKAERGKDRSGHVGLDDVSLKRGQCTKA
ncbi:nephronectin isoform 4-T4 [Leptodactylus fuscus]|uniref:nephronectin isoform X4 n=1 Tax=Leptodactylus fuscus TaxID=238119 RepID=UPI003F4EFD00